MNVGQLQKVDKWLGVPLCFVLTLSRFLFSRSASPGKPRSVLFIKLAEQGSTVLAVPAIRAAINLVGVENVYFIVFEDNRFILDALGIIPKANVFTVSQAGPLSMCSSIYRSLKTIRKKQIQAAIDMEFFARGSAAIALLSGCPTRVGFHPFFNSGPYRGDLMTHRLLYNPHLHTAATFVSMVRAITADSKLLPTFPIVPADVYDPAPSFEPRPDELSKVKALLSNLPSYARLILLNPNASDLLPLRRWPAERYVALAKRLLSELGDAAIVFTGAPAEASKVGQLAAEVGSERCISLAGKTTLRDLLVLFTLADVLVTNDSGPAHFAALTPVHVVTLFGPETPALYRSLSSRDTPLWAGIVCSPCVNAFNNRQSPCRNNLCMQLLSVDQVMAEAMKALGKRRARGIVKNEAYGGVATRGA
jgi:ADP-heptose:LPS heptosyltransferase